LSLGIIAGIDVGTKQAMCTSTPVGVSREKPKTGVFVLRADEKAMRVDPVLALRYE
jgi:hypothetical protein